MENLEQRHLMAGGFSPDPGIGIIDDVEPRNIGSANVTAFNITERELPTGRGLNDSPQSAEFLPLGTGTAQQNTIDVTGFLPQRFFAGGLTGSLPEDQDYFSFDLQAGDILDVAGNLGGAIGSIDLFFGNGRLWFAAEANQGAGSYPASSPLMDVGNVVAAQVVPFTGRYFLRAGNNNLSTATSYTLGLRVYRPILEQQPIGTTQKIYLDFDGGTFPSSVFSPGIPGTIRIPSLTDSLPLLNLQPRDENAFIDRVLIEVRKRFDSVVSLGGNGDFDNTGVAGQFAIEFLNSRDNPDPGSDPFVTRAFIGGIGANANLPPVFGVAQSVDVGNFDPSEFIILPLEAFEPTAASIPRSNAVSLLEATAVRFATTLAHEIAHTVGLYHTNNANNTPSIIDTGGPLQVQLNALGVGPDGIFGTEDDVPIIFPIFDQFDPFEGFIGNEYVAASLAFALSSGRVGSALTGTVFNDVNRDGRLSGSSETGLAGATVFVDRNGNGVFDPGETSTVTAANGSYSIAVAPGTVRIVVAPPSGFVGTSPVQTVTVTTGGATNVNLGVSRVSADITGTKWADLDGNGFQDAGEPGLAGVFIYLDLDGDDNIDIFEPRSVTDVNGNYTINFPGPGTYTIREVVAPGFVQTFPVGGEHTVVFTGAPLGNNFNFGNLPSLDFGDAPDSYRTTLAAGGPSHGLLAGLSLGSGPDRELDGRPSIGADGDDVAGLIGAGGVVIDDEDGVRVLTPIGPGANATFEVTLTNTTGQTGFLQAWADFNRNGNFDDAGERIIVDATRAAGVNLFSIPVPSSVTPGPLYTRFRYSLVPGVGIGGQTDAGEVEDHVFTIQASANLANPDSFSVTRNSQANFLDVLTNDFETPTSQLTITSIDRGATNPESSVIIANGGRGILYTPPTGFIGRDTFTYTVRNTAGQTATTTVSINVSFLSDVPIAVDDSFEVAEGSSSIALNVLDNDIPSRLGGVTIISVTPGSAGGLTSLAGGNQTIRYTPRAGFNGTEEFTYSISDTAGNVSSAKATINLLPGSRNDDLVAFAVNFLDVTNNLPINDGEAILVGDEFLVQVTVQDLRSAALNRGVFAAFLDLLYTDGLVAPVASSANPLFNFDITFGDEFSSQLGADQTGDANTPGLFNDVGSLRRRDTPTAPEVDPITLFTVRVQAVAPGIAVFSANPADDPINETALFSSQTATTVAQQRLGFNEILILPASGNVTAAVDDAFLNGVDSLGQTIRGGVAATLNVTANDNLGPTGIIDEFAILIQPAIGVVSIGANNTIIYTPDASENGFDSFTYSIQTADGVRSSARVSLNVGAATGDDLIDFTLRLVNEAGVPITGAVPAGSRFGVQFIVDDLRDARAANPLGVFAAYADILYDAGIVAPSNTITVDDFNFDVVFASDFDSVGASGVFNRRGIIDEFGSFLFNSSPSTDPPNPALTGNPVLLATLFFNAIGTGTAVFKTDPADVPELHDSLLFQPSQVVPPSMIRYGVLSVTVGGGAAGGEGESRHNSANPADVNNDGLVTPTDALMIINEISRSRLSSGEAQAVTSAVRRYPDVSGDGKVTPQDALQVINAISRRGRQSVTGSSGESPKVTSQVTTLTSVAALEEVQTIRTADFSLPNTSNATPAVTITGFDVSGDEDDVLDLLAGDVATVWQ